jgi:hypothetical protein
MSAGNAVLVMANGSNEELSSTIKSVTVYNLVQFKDLTQLTSRFAAFVQSILLLRGCVYH